jgi:hypothetical protein
VQHAIESCRQRLTCRSHALAQGEVLSVETCSISRQLDERARCRGDQWSVTMQADGADPASKDAEPRLAE